MTVAGELSELNAPPSPPPESWASQEGSNVAIWIITLQPGAQWTVPSGPSGVGRSLYFVSGDKVEIAEQTISSKGLLPTMNWGGLVHSVTQFESMLNLTSPSLSWTLHSLSPPALSHTQKNHGEVD